MYFFNPKIKLNNNFKKFLQMSALSCLMNTPRMKMYFFRNYNLPPGVYTDYLGSCNHTMWEVIRASTAAPGYFESFIMDDLVHQVSVNTQYYIHLLNINQLVWVCLARLVVLFVCLSFSLSLSISLSLSLLTSGIGPPSHFSLSSLKVLMSLGFVGQLKWISFPYCC